MPEPYHPYVFNKEKREFVGKFEEMYQQEDAQGFSAWHQDDLSIPVRRLALELLRGYTYRKIVDVGCGTGAFLNTLKREGTELTGYDLSPTAIQKARARYPGIGFHVARVEEIPWVRHGRVSLVILSEILSYLQDWRAVLQKASDLADLVFISLYIPSDPIGYVKTPSELRDAVRENYHIEHDIVYNGSNHLIMARTKTSFEMLHGLPRVNLDDSLTENLTRDIKARAKATEQGNGTES